VAKNKGQSRQQTKTPEAKVNYGKESSLRRKEAQDLREQVNRDNYPALSPWETSRKKRHSARIARGLTYENWRKNNSARAKNEEPSVSNTVTRSGKRNSGVYVSKSYAGTFNTVAHSQEA
jgi:hypothetical protein